MRYKRQLEKENVIANMERNRKLGLPITWVTYEQSVMKEIKRITEGKDEYLLKMM